MVVFDLIRVTGAFVGGIARVATGAGIHGGDEHEIGGVGDFLVGSRDGNDAVF